MKSANADLIAYLDAKVSAGDRSLLYTDVFSIDLRGGTDDNFRLRWTGGQQNLTAYDLNGDPAVKVWRADQAIVSGVRMKASVGVSVDEQAVVITPMPGALVQGLPILEAVRRRIFDGAAIRRDRYFFESRLTALPIGALPMFYGLISTFTRISRLAAELKVKSANVLLDQQMPRHLFQPACIWTLYDAGCGLDKAAHAVHGVVGASPTLSIIPTSIADAGFTLGSVFFENMADIGVTRMIRSATATQLVLAYPLPEMPQAGDLIVCYPGCDRSATRCDALGNLARRRSYDFVPQGEKAV